MRDFNTDEVKNFNAMSPIEEKCQKGLLNQASLWFSMPDESNAKLVVSSLIAFEERVINHGLEGVFLIVQVDGTVLNMLQEPGGVPLPPLMRGAPTFSPSEPEASVIRLFALPFAHTTELISCGRGKLC